MELYTVKAKGEIYHDNQFLYIEFLKSLQQMMNHLYYDPFVSKGICMWERYQVMMN